MTTSPDRHPNPVDQILGNDTAGILDDVVVLLSEAQRRCEKANERTGREAPHEALIGDAITRVRAALDHL